MTSPFATLLIALQERITSQVPAIRWVDQDFGQMEVEQPPVSFPCCLIDFDTFKFEDNGEAEQFADGLVTLRLGFTPFSQTNNITPTEWKEKGLTYYDLEYQLYKALHGWKPESYGYMMRVSAETERREDVIRVRVIRFSCSFFDQGAMPTYGSAPKPEGFEADVSPN